MRRIYASLTFTALAHCSAGPSEPMGESSLGASTCANTIYGTSGDDTLVGTGADDCIYGFGGNDTISGGGGNDTISGGAGDDSLYGEAGLDRLLGDDDNDTLYGGADADNLRGGKGNDTISGGAGNDYILGEDDNDVIQGGSENDNISGGTGDDIIAGEAGNDVLDGGGGIDQVSGGEGRDTLFGGAGVDTLSGGNGDDYLKGGSEGDVLDGEAGSDQMLGESGADRFFTDVPGDRVTREPAESICGNGVLEAPEVCDDGGQVAGDGCYLCIVEPSAMPKVAAGGFHTCAIRTDGQVVCWGANFYGQLGYGHSNYIGDDETPASAGTVDLGAGRTATQVTAGTFHTCALLDDGAVRCWGANWDGQLGYGHANNIGDDETPGFVGSVDLGSGRTATQLSAGWSHTCARLDDATVKCWGNNEYGQLGYANTIRIGDDEAPASAGPVALGPGRVAAHLVAGAFHTCALLDDATVKCWGHNAVGQLGRGNTSYIGDNETPAAVGPVDFGPGRTATQLAAGSYHNCVILDDASLKCWGYNSTGQLGYGNTSYIGDDETPASVGPVDLGPGRTASQVVAGGVQVCVVLDDATVKCWGGNASGELGYGNTDAVGDDEAPEGVGSVDLGPGRTATQLACGEQHTCAVLDGATVKCWGNNGNGQLGYGNTFNIGDDETPASVGPVLF